MKQTEATLKELRMTLAEREHQALQQLSPARRRDSVKPFLQNFEEARTIRTVRALRQALGLNASEDIDVLAISPKGVIDALIATIGIADPYSERWDALLLEDLRARCTEDGQAPDVLLGADNGICQLPKWKREKEKCRVRANGEALWAMAREEAINCKARAERALGVDDAKKSALHRYVFAMLFDLEDDYAAQRRAYWCLLVLRDGITLQDYGCIDSFIERADPASAFLEYYEVRYPPTDNHLGHAMYVGLSFEGGNAGSLRFDACRHNRQEVDRHIAGMRGHFTSEGEIETRSAGLASRIKVTVFGTEKDAERVARDLQEEGIAYSMLILPKHLAPAPGAETDEFHRENKCIRVSVGIFKDLVASNTSTSRLVIRAIGDIHRIPFEMLPWEPGRSLVGDRFGILYCPEPLLFGEAAAPCDLRPVSGPLVVSDCDFDLDSDPGSAAGAMDVTLRVPNRSRLFEPLMGTAAEGRAVHAIVGGTLLEQADASKRAVVSELARRPRAVHFATHSFYVDRFRYHAETLTSDNRITRASPKFSNNVYEGILLSGANGYIDSDRTVRINPEGLLGMSDVLKLDLTGTQIITLSGCESGIGAVDEGNVLDSLRAAFLQIGARCVVSSLWPVEDRDAASFMEALYRNLMLKLPMSEAMRRTRLELQEMPIASRCAFVCFGAESILEL